MSSPKSGKKSKELGGAAKTYLFLYNAIQSVGWSILLLQIIEYYITGQYKEKDLWDHVWLTTSIFQNLAVLEIVNSFLGFVSSSVMVTGVQVYSRVYVVCGIWWMVPESKHNNVGVTMALVAWSITEITRYSFYALSLINSVPYFLIWCRYTFFFALYPIGVSGELLCQYTAQNIVGRDHLYCIDMPNKLNFSFNYQYFIIFNMLGYIPGFPPLYMYMISQRKKIIGGGQQKPIKKAN